MNYHLMKPSDMALLRKQYALADIGRVVLLPEDCSVESGMVEISNDEIAKLVALDAPVSYTHLDVYKRQTRCCPSRAWCTIRAGNTAIWAVSSASRISLSSWSELSKMGTTKRRTCVKKKNKKRASLKQNFRGALFLYYRSKRQNGSK